MKKFAVIGNPVAHSLSPVIHKAFAHQFNIELEYGTIKADIGKFAASAGHFRDQGGVGLNVTVPFKQDAFDWADALSERASQAQAVNTISFNNGRIFGDNTDGIGLVRDLKDNLGVELQGKSVLILGAGGAVRGVLGPILAQIPARILVANRTAEKARRLVECFAGSGEIAACAPGEIPAGDYDLVINATAASLDGSVPSIAGSVVENSALAYDMMYAAAPTVFMQWAKSNGAGRVCDGLGMLIEQAAQSFVLWHGSMPDTQPVFSVINRQLGRA